MLGRWEIVLATLCRACRTSFGLWNVCCSESQCFAESCQKEAHCNVLRQIAQILESNQLCKRASETRLQRKRGSLPHTPWFVLGKSLLGHKFAYILWRFCCSYAISEDGKGQWEREGSSDWVLEWVCSRKTILGAKVVCLCMIQPFIIWVFPNLGSGCGLQVVGVSFFRNPAETICRIEVRHFV